MLSQEAMATTDRELVWEALISVEKHNPRAIKEL